MSVALAALFCFLTIQLYSQNQRVVSKMLLCYNVLQNFFIVRAYGGDGYEKSRFILLICEPQKTLILQKKLARLIRKAGILAASTFEKSTS